MIDYDKIFHRNGGQHSTDIEALLMALFDPNNTLSAKRKVWKRWRN